MPPTRHSSRLWKRQFVLKTHRFTVNTTQTETRADGIRHIWSAMLLLWEVDWTGHWFDLHTRDTFIATQMLLLIYLHGNTLHVNKHRTSIFQDTGQFMSCCGHLDSVIFVNHSSLSFLSVLPKSRDLLTVWDIRRLGGAKRELFGAARDLMRGFRVGGVDRVGGVTCFAVVLDVERVRGMIVGGDRISVMLRVELVRGVSMGRVERVRYFCPLSAGEWKLSENVSLSSHRDGEAGTSWKHLLLQTKHAFNTGQCWDTILHENTLSTLFDEIKIITCF